MVARAGHDRYRLLDTLRAYALEALGELDADETRDRHADVYVQLAEHGEVEIRGSDQLAWLDQFRSEINNLRAALEWCLLTGDISRAARLAGALAWFWTLNGSYGRTPCSFAPVRPPTSCSRSPNPACGWRTATSPSTTRTG
jgi:predicted ATPase